MTELKEILTVIEYDDSSGTLKYLAHIHFPLDEIITGKNSGNIATIENLENYEGIL